MLPVLEFPTAAVYHATKTTLDNLDKVRRRFLREVGLTEEEALLYYNLAPLNTRRDIAAGASMPEFFGCQPVSSFDAHGGPGA